MHITEHFLFILVMAQVLLLVLGTGYYGIEFWKFGKKRPAYGKTWNRINTPMYSKKYPWTNPYYPIFPNIRKLKDPHFKYESTQSDHVALTNPIVYTSFLPPLYVKTLPYLPPTTVSNEFGNVLPNLHPNKIDYYKQVEKPNVPTTYKAPKIMLLKVIKDVEKVKPAIENDVKLAGPNKPGNLFLYLSEMPKSTTTVVLNAKDKPSVPDSALNITTALPKSQVSFDVRVVDIPNNASKSVIESPSLFSPEPTFNSPQPDLSPVRLSSDVQITSDNPDNTLVKTALTPAQDNLAPDIARNQVTEKTAVYPIVPTPENKIIEISSAPNIDGNQMVDAVSNQLLFDNHALDLSILGNSTSVGVSLKLLDVHGDQNPGDIMTADIVVPNFQLNNNMAFIDVGDGKHVTLHGNLDGFQDGQHNDVKVEDMLFEIPGANNEILNPFIGFDRVNTFVEALGAGGDLHAVIQQTDLNLDLHGGNLLLTNRSINTGRRPVTITRNPFYLMLNIEPFGPGPYGQCREPAMVVCGARYGWDHVIGMTEWCQHNCVVFMYSSYCDDDRCECECK